MPYLFLLLSCILVPVFLFAFSYTCSWFFCSSSSSYSLSCFYLYCYFCSLSSALFCYASCSVSLSSTCVSSPVLPPLTLSSSSPPLSHPLFSPGTPSPACFYPSAVDAGPLVSSFSMYSSWNSSSRLIYLPAPVSVSSLLLLSFFLLLLLHVLLVIRH